MRKTTAKAMAALLALVMLLSLASCGHEHTWADATCTTPKTCTECGKIEGEVLAHDWQDATCAAPKTCSLCKETEGEPLPHTWEEATCSAPKTCTVCGETEGKALPHTLTEANYQSPATCTVCGAEVGEKRKASYEEHPFPLMEQGVTYDCLFAGYQNGSAVLESEVPAHVTLTDVYHFDSDETYPAMEGYEYIHASLEIELYGDVFWGYDGYYYSYYSWNYYYDLAENVDENGEIHNGGSDENGNLYAFFNFNGVDWEDGLIHKEETDTDWDYDAKTANFTLNYIMRVPVGYDGVIIGVFHPRFSDAFDTAIYLADIYEDGYFLAFRIE